MKRNFLFAIALILISSCKEKDDRNSPENSSAISISMLQLTALNGQSIDLSQYKGKTVFINFWATWCKPCVAEMPSLQRMTEKLKGGNIVFLFASDEISTEIEEFKNTKGYALDFVRVENFSDLNIMGLPTTFIFDKNGKLIFSEMGAREWDSEESISLITKSNTR
jgi:thiol-disulfide isomerase/thioredoxin